MTAAAFFVAVVVVVAAAAFLMAVVVVVTAAALLMFLGLGGAVPGTDDHIALHLTGQGGELRDQTVRVLGSEPQLFGGEGDHRILHLRMGIEFPLDLGGAVGAVQILDPVYLPGHEGPSFISIYEQTLMCLFQYIPFQAPCQGTFAKTFPICIEEKPL